MFIIRFLLLILLIGLLIGGGVMAFIFRSLNNATRHFKQQANHQPKSDKDTVEDRRSPHEVNKKIIPQDEGEYVDFEEEK